MVFSSEVEAYHTYVAYALCKDFGVRGEITWCTFVCSCEGFSCPTPGQQKKMERTDNRCSCLAHILFKVDNGVHEVM